MKSLIILSLLFTVFCHNFKLITLPRECTHGNVRYIDTSLGIIRFYSDQYKTYEISIKDIKNLEKYSILSPYSTRVTVNNKEVIFTALGNVEGYHSQYLLNSLICDLFYQTQYINKKVYSFNKESVFHGGIPSIPPSMKDAKFKINTYISKIKITLPDNSENIIEENDLLLKKDYALEFSDDKKDLCFSEKIFNILNDTFINKYERFYQFLILRNQKEKLFFKIEMTIGDYYIKFREKDLHILANGLKYLNIYPQSCDKNYIGVNFFEKLYLTAFDLNKNEVTLYDNSGRIFKN